MIVLIDNYDSFVNNLARYFERLGQHTTVVRNDAVDSASIADLRPAAIVMSPGPCSPRDAGASLAIARAWYASLPMLGVCLGHQIVAEALGGRIVRASRPVHGQATSIEHENCGLFRGLPSPLRVGRYHSLIVEPTSLPSELRATAWSDDGVLMAFEHRRWPVYGVQFHPESILTECGYGLLANFLRLAGLQPVSSASELGNVELRKPATVHPALPVGPVPF